MPAVLSEASCISLALCLFYLRVAYNLRKTIFLNTIWTFLPWLHNHRISHFPVS